VIGPADLPAEQATKAASVFKAAISSPTLSETLTAQGFVVSGTSPEEARVFFASELEKHEALVKESGAVLE